MSRDVGYNDEEFGQALLDLERFLREEIFLDMGISSEVHVGVKAVAGEPVGLRVTLVTIDYDDDDAYYTTCYPRDHSLFGQALLLACEEFMLIEADIELQRLLRHQGHMIQMFGYHARRLQKKDKKWIMKGRAEENRRLTTPPRQRRAPAAQQERIEQ